MERKAQLPGPSNYQTQLPTGGRHSWKIKYNLHDSLHVQPPHQAQISSIQISDIQKYKIPLSHQQHHGTNTIIHTAN